jgi:filamentous hemagglutinin family protein
LIMNAGIFRLVFNKRQGKLVPVSEITSAQGKAAGGESGGVNQVGLMARPRLLPLLISLICAGPIFANPTNPTVINGQVSFDSVGNTLTINNSANAIINWQGFGINANEITRFNQPNAQSSVLNRVTGADPSNIMGQLQSNGKVFLINPNGILFGRDSRVDVGGLVASTLNLSNEDFLNSQFSFSGNHGSAGVVNQGQINSTAGGKVWLIGHNVENSGLINSPGGEVVLAAGQTVDLVPNGAEGLSVTFTADNNQAVNLGEIVANGGNVNVFSALINQQGVIQADSFAVGKNGRISLRAKKTLNLAEGSVTQANATHDNTNGGEILAFANMADGTVNVAGSLHAQAKSGAGGFIETSAATVKVVETAQVNTLSENGVAGTWLIDPNDFTVAVSGGNISGTLLSNSLTGGSVVISSAQGTTGGHGDIFVNDGVSWSANTLTLTAERGINVNAVMNATGSAGLAMNTGGSGTVAMGFNADGSFKGKVNLGSGTSLSVNYIAYNIIHDVNVLQAMQLGGLYALGSDIDAVVTVGWNADVAGGFAGFAPVGNDSTFFNGVLDGLGHVVSGLTINRPTTSYVGLIGKSGSGSVIRNVGLSEGG